MASLLVDLALYRQQRQRQQQHQTYLRGRMYPTPSSFPPSHSPPTAAETTGSAAGAPLYPHGCGGDNWGDICMNSSSVATSTTAGVLKVELCDDRQQQQIEEKTEEEPGQQQPHVERPVFLPSPSPSDPIDSSDDCSTATSAPGGTPHSSTSSTTRRRHRRRQALSSSISQTPGSLGPRKRRLSWTASSSSEEEPALKRSRSSLIFRASSSSSSSSSLDWVLRQVAEQLAVQQAQLLEIQDSLVELRSHLCSCPCSTVATHSSVAAPQVTGAAAERCTGTIPPASCSPSDMMSPTTPGPGTPYTPTAVTSTTTTTGTRSPTVDDLVSAIQTLATHAAVSGGDSDMHVSAPAPPAAALRSSDGLPPGVWYDRVENRYVVQCNETTACGRKKRRYFGVSRYGEEGARQSAIRERLRILGLLSEDGDQHRKKAVDATTATKPATTTTTTVDIKLRRPRAVPDHAAAAAAVGAATMDYPQHHHHYHRGGNGSQSSRPHCAVVVAPSRSSSHELITPTGHCCVAPHVLRPSYVQQQVCDDGAETQQQQKAPSSSRHTAGCKVLRPSLSEYDFAPAASSQMVVKSEPQQQATTETSQLEPMTTLSGPESAAAASGGGNTASAYDPAGAAAATPSVAGAAGLLSIVLALSMLGGQADSLPETGITTEELSSWLALPPSARGEAAPPPEKTA